MREQSRLLRRAARGYSQDVLVTQEQLAALVQLAREAALRAYAPYSGFRVGAALLLEGGAIVTGCNVENSSYSVTVCAERTALFRAVAERGPKPRIEAVAVANLNQAPSPPCGACRQALSEFALPGAMVIFPGEGGVAREPMPFRELFPHSFRLHA